MPTDLMTAEQRHANNLALKDAIIEADKISRNQRPSKAQSNRFQFLSQQIALLKSGYSIDYLNRSRASELATRDGFNAPDFRPAVVSHAERREADAWRTFFRTGNVPVEYRDTEGIPLAVGSFQGNGGSFVPFEFFRDYLPQALKAVDPTFDDAAVTLLVQQNGKPLQVPSFDPTDESNDAVPISELSSPGFSSIANPGQVLVSLTTFRTPGAWKVSMEAFEDIESAGNTINTFKTWASGSLARGVGRFLMNNLLSTLATNFPSATIIASGSAANTDGSENGANSLGTRDFAVAFAALDSAYRASSRCAWWMADDTLQSMVGMLDKNGREMNLVKFVDGEPLIYGKPVRIAPSIDSIGASQTPVLFGDFSQWMTRIALDQSYIKLFRQAPGLAENGNFGLRVFLRAGGAWMISSTERPPVIAIQNHS
jgi:HK97 family phage major capsid protein